MSASAFDLVIIQRAASYLRLRPGLELAAELVQAAASNGVAFVVFPGIWLLGHPLWAELVPRAARWAEEGAREWPGVRCDP